MKLFTSILFILLSYQGFSQIIIRGAKNTEIIETNKEKSEVKEIKDINFTKSKEEKIDPTYVKTNTISTSKVESKGEFVEINIIGNESSGDEKNELVIDLDEAKENIDSTNYYNNPNGITIIKEVNNNTPKTETLQNTSNTIVEKEKELIEPEITNESVPVNKPVVTEIKKESTIFFNEKPKAVETVIPQTSTTVTGIELKNEDVRLVPLTENDPETIVVEEKVQTPIIETNSVEVEEPKIITNAPSTSLTDINTAKNQNKESGIIIESTKNKTEILNTTITDVKTEEIEFEDEVTVEKEMLIEKEVPSIVKETETIKIDEPKINTSGNLNNLDNLNVSDEKVVSSTSTAPIKVESNLNNLDNLNTSTSSTSESEENDSNPKKGSWSMSLRAGVPAIIGDVNSKAGYGAALSIQKAMGHIFSLRFEALGLETYGLSPNEINGTYPNYKTRFSDYTLQGVFTLNNLNFYKKEPKVLYNILVGGGLATRYTWIDAMDTDGNFYNYDVINSSSRKETLSALKDIMDRNYETSIAKDVDKMSIKNTNILPTLVVGMGIDFKLSEKLDLNLSTRFSNHFDDNLDGLKNGSNSDWMSFTSLGLTYKFGSKNKSLLWTNPVYAQTEELDDLKKKVSEGDLLKDEDKDGIADIFDQDLNTPEKVAVDSRGVPSDMDKDGIPDYKDAQPFTPIGAQVNEQGIALDTDNDGIADVFDLENNTIPGNQVDANGRSIKTVKEDGLKMAKENSDFDLIFFDENSTKIKKEFYSILYKVSRYIDGNPNAQIQITGYTDVLNTEDFNLNLSEKRANAVYSMLIQMFKVDANNLVTSFKGESEPIIEGLPEQKDYNMEAAYYINRRVEFKILK